MHHFEKTLLLSPSNINISLMAMGIFGIGGGIGAGVIIDKTRPRLQGLLGVVGSCSIIAFGLAILSFQITHVILLVLLMAAMGLNLGVLIVLLLLVFNRFIHLRVRGLFAGLATAAAYFAANVMSIYIKEPVMFGTVNAIAIGTNIIVLIFIWDYSKSARLQPMGQSQKDSLRPKALMALMLLILVDTYCFYPVGKEGFGPNPILVETWDWLKNGIWHLLIPLMAGIFSFSLGNRRLMQIGFFAMALCSGLLIVNHYSPVANVIYPAWGLTVGVYTIALFTVWGALLPEKNQGFFLGVGIAACAWVGSSLGISSSILVTKTGLLDFPYYFIPGIILSIAGFYLLLSKDVFYDYAEKVKMETREESESLETK